MGVCLTALGFVQLGIMWRLVAILSLLPLCQQHRAATIVSLHRATSIP